MSTSSQLPGRVSASAARAIGRTFGLYGKRDHQLKHGSVLRPHADTKRFGFSHINVVDPIYPRHIDTSPVWLFSGVPEPRCSTTTSFPGRLAIPPPSP